VQQDQLVIDVATDNSDGPQPSSPQAAELVVQFPGQPPGIVQLTLADRQLEILPVGPFRGPGCFAGGGLLFLLLGLGEPTVNAVEIGVQVQVRGGLLGWCNAAARSSE
jgi:hypothetical protein